MANTPDPEDLLRRSPVLLGLVLSLCLLAACDQEQVRQTGGGEAPPSPSAFQPEEGRLVGVEWADVSTPAQRKERAPAVRRSAMEAVGDLKERRTLRQLRGDAVLSLMNDDPDAAVLRLSKAVEIEPENAIVLSDLAAARLQRSKAFSDPYDLVLALAAAHRAVKADPELLPAAYNRALALQRLSLDLRAREEWQRYQARETDPFWWNAAQEHATALAHSSVGPTKKESHEAVQRAVERGDQQEVQKIVARSPRVLREYVEQDLLGAWAEAEGEHREAEAQKLLATARAIGAALAAVNGEHMAADTVAQIDTVRTTAPQRLSRLVAGLRAYKQGLTLAEQEGAFERGLPLLETAHRLLAEERSPFAGWATFRIAICRYEHAEYDRALALIRPLIQDPSHRRYAALQGRAHWLEGLIALIRGDPAAALPAYEAALANFQKLRERSHAARMTGQAALALDTLGRRSDAWRRLQPALVEPSTHESPFARRSLCIAASSLAQEEGETEIALWFQEEVVRNALANGVAYPAADALRGSSELLAALGRREEAVRDVERARSRLSAVPDPTVRTLLDGDLRLVEARLAASPQEALALLDRTIETFRASSYHFQLARALFERARSHQALGDSPAAEHDLTAAIDELELQRERIDDPEARISYFDRAREVLDAMLLLQLEQLGQPEVAFRYSEQAKSRALLDWVVAHPFGSDPASLQATGPAAADPASLQSELPANTVVVEYAVLPQKLVIWVLRNDAFHVETVAISAKDLASRVRRLSHELSLERKADVLKAASDLQETLIRPIEKHLAPGDRIVAVPDGVLHAVPFAVLYDARTRRYLVQDRIWSVAPSLRLLIASLRRDEEIARRRDPRALVVVDPDFDQEIYPFLDRLKASRQEANAAGFFPGSRVLGGPDATREAFLQDAGEYEIVHFGGHSLVNSSFPLLSQMLFATAPDDPSRGILYSGDLLVLRFERTRLAVLASCSTAAGRISRTEGVQSLARPFLAAGVPAVIASLWDVDDEKTAALFGRFYRHLQETFDPATALQKAQVDSINQGAAQAADPWAWGAFEVIGGISPGR